MLCARIEPIVRGLEAEYGQQMRFAVRPFDQGDAPDLIKRYELGLHGMVVTDQTGAVQWKEPGHNQTRSGVEAAIKKLLDE